MVSFSFAKFLPVGKPRREFSWKGTKVREKENAEAREGERKAQVSQMEPIQKSMWG